MRLLLRPVKLMKHLHQRALLNPRHIAPRNPKLFRNFALRFFFLQIKAEAADDDFFFSAVKDVDVFFVNATHRLSVFVVLKC